MPGYFSYFPTIFYDANCGANGTAVAMTSVVDITRRFRILPSLLSRAVLFYTYDVLDGERPDTVSYKFYQDSQLEWLVLLSNKIADPMWDWPLGYNDLAALIAAKYGSADAALRGIHHYEQILQEADINADGSVIPEQTVIIDYTAYLALPATQTKSVTYYDYEQLANDARRSIKIIRNEFLGQILSEATNILKA